MVVGVPGVLHMRCSSPLRRPCPEAEARVPCCCSCACALQEFPDITSLPSVAEQLQTLRQRIEALNGEGARHT